MKLHNTLSRKVEDVKPLDAKKFRVYSCGPTVYDHIHIGNLSSFIFVDMLRRTLAASDNEVHHVMNFTDVDDKTIARSREKFAELEPAEALKKLTDQYGQLFFEDMQAIGNSVAALDFVKATESIESIQKLIKRLHQDGFAYIADDGVYFSIEAYRKSGKVYGQLTQITTESTSNARIDNDEYDKESAHDFALWKKQKPGEPVWDFELDGQDLKGRPGWHIECSAMSAAKLGQPFDIHTGGADLIFPHHENEIAQSTAGQDNPIYAKVFVHNEHLLVDGQKMSKSLNNYYTIADIQKQGFDPMSFRLLVLQSHYRSQAHFSWQALEAAQNRLQDLRAMAALRWQPRPVTHDNGTFALEEVPVEMLAHLTDDLNTPKALAFLSEISTQLQTVHIEADMVGHFTKMLQGIDDLLGLNLLAVKDISEAQKELLKDRETVRAAQNWARSDELREQLRKQGIGVQDATHGVIWYPLATPAS